MSTVICGLCAVWSQHISYPTCGESDDCRYEFWSPYRLKTEYLEKVNCMEEFMSTA